MRHYSALLFALALLVVTLFGCGGAEGMEEDSISEEIEIGQTVSGLSTARVSATNLSVFQCGDYMSNGMLRYGNQSFSVNPLACSTRPYTGGLLSLRVNNTTYKRPVSVTVNGVAESATQVRSGGSDWGQCVALAAQVANYDIGSSCTWSRGVNVLASGTVQVGTIVATMSSPQNTYCCPFAPYNHTCTDHVGVFGGYTYSNGQRNGFILYDQNWGLDGLVRRHPIYSSSQSNTANASRYYVVQTP